MSGRPAARQVRGHSRSPRITRPATPGTWAPMGRAANGFYRRYRGSVVQGAANLTIETGDAMRDDALRVRITNSGSSEVQVMITDVYTGKKSWKRYPPAAAAGRPHRERPGQPYGPGDGQPRRINRLFCLDHSSGGQGVASGAYSVGVAPGALEGQPPGVRCDQLVDGVRPPGSRGVKTYG